MNAYWIEPAGACVEAKTNAEAFEKAKKLGLQVLTCDKLPYPAEPRMGEQSNCPSFCYSPRTCKGNGSCPKGYACSE